MSLSRQFLSKIQSLQQEAAESNRETLARLGEEIGRSIAGGGVLHLFGSGHSRIVAMEIERRAGGLVPVSTIEDPTPGWAERIQGFGKKLFLRYRFQYEPQPGEFLIVVSNSGKNAAPLEVALEAKECGLRVVALTSLAMSRESVSMLPSGKRLFEIAEFVLDNLGIPGDASLDIPGSDRKVGPTSTLTGTLLLNLLNLEMIDYLLSRDIELPIIMSQNLPGGPEHNEALAEKYRNRIRRPI